MYIPGKDSGATPMTVKSPPFRRTVLPTTEGSPANSRFQKSGAEHDHGVAAGNPILVVPKAAPERRLDAEHAEVVAGDQHPAPDPRRRAGLGG